MKYLMSLLSFLSLSCSSPKNEDDILLDKINNSLIELFRSHNIKAKKGKNDILNIDTNQNISIKSNLTFKEYPDDYLSRLDIKIELPNGKEIYECFGDIASSKEKAVDSNLLNFNKNDFHVILNAFNNSSDDQITVEEWIINDLKYKVYIGNFGIKSTVKFNIPDNIFDKIEQIIKNKNYRMIFTGYAFSTQTLISNLIVRSF